jgi:hypothetical protein
LTLVPSRDPVTAGLALLEEERLGQARHHFWLDAETAFAAGDAERLATAALGLGGLWVHEHRLTLERARVDGVQRKALDALDPSSSLARRLCIRLAAEETYATGDTRPILAELEQARERPDPLVLAEALSLASRLRLPPISRWGTCRATRSTAPHSPTPSTFGVAPAMRSERATSGGVRSTMPSGSA